ncbi:hypothetical protein PWT90_02056 [Aphanocladium album]|nr:hypothetical protein PWT90_02056 [Aphanocladium album]
MSASPRPPFDSLPLDILCQVCEHLSSLEYNRQSLLSFSLVSKKCGFATARERFSCISLTTRSPARLESDVARLSKTLSDACAYTCVRRVNIVGRTELCPENNYGDSSNDDDDDGQDEPPGPDSNAQRRERDEKIEAWGWTPLQHHRFFSPHFYPTQLPQNQCYCEKPHDTGGEAEVWEPLVSLLRHLPALTDIVVEGMRLAPRSILRYLHVHKPSCRVHMNSFRLASQTCTKHQQKNITDDEYLLITSPCLYSIITSHSVNYIGPHVDYNGEAIVAMLARYSPNLRHLWTKRTLPGGEIGLAENLDTPRPSWGGFFPDVRVQSQDVIGPSSRTGQLDSLVLGGYRIALNDYMRATDFSRLSGLHIMEPVDDNMMRDLVRLGQSHGLALLDSLSLRLPNDNGIRATELARELLTCVPPLRYFYFDAKAAAERVLSIVFSRHGQTLRTLCIKAAEISTESLEELQSQCPMLRQLMITLPRKPGDEHEARIYRTLGKLTHLERLTIRLLIPPPCEAAVDLEFKISHSDEECVEYLKRHLPRFAVDAKLAKSMFCTVATEQRAKAGKSSLERLCLRPRSEGGEHVDISDIQGPTFWNVAEWIARSWVCRPRSWTDTPRDGNDETRAQSFDLVAERCFIEPSEEYLKEEMEDIMWDGMMGKAWKALWPEAGDDWLESWSSVPILGSD